MCRPIVYDRMTHRLMVSVTVLDDRCKTVCPMLSDRCLSVLSVTLVYCGQTVAQIKMKLGKQVGLVPGHIGLDGDSGPPPQMGTASPTIFGQCLLWPNGSMDQDATW